MTDAIDRARELLARAEQLLPAWTSWAPEDHRPAEAIRAAREALERPCDETAAVVARATLAASSAYDVAYAAVAAALDAAAAAKAACSAARSAALAAAQAAEAVSDGIERSTP